MGAPSVLVVSALLCCLTPIVAGASKLNKPRVLLPFSEEGTDFVLRSDDDRGCFKWKSTRPELVSITPLHEDVARGCSSSAVVAANSKTWTTKLQSVITAEDVNSPGHYLRCDVIIDAIQSLQIVTKTHELFLEEAPEEFQVRGYDDQGNEFTTVDKMIFKWNIENIVKKTGSLHGDSIRFINFRDSTYAFDQSVMEIESSGRQGCRVLLEGTKTGSSKVSVRLAGAAYAKVAPAEVNVMVVANLYLVPGTAFVMVGGKVSYHAEQIKSNKIHKIRLPSQQYLLQVEDSKFARLDSATEAIVQGIAHGSTEVTLKDTNLAPEDIVRPPQADLHVVSPKYITLTVNPHKNWNVIVGNEYDIVVEIFDKNQNKIYPSDNIVMTVQISPEFFEVKAKTENGTLHSGSPVKVGSSEVKATLFGVKDENGRTIELDPPLHTHGELEISDKIILKPEVEVFPWDPLSGAKYSSQFDIVGTSKTTGAPFLWSSSDQTVATINQNGVASSLETSPIGETIVTAAMDRARHNYGVAKVLVIPAAGLDLLDHVLETQIGSSLPLPISFYGIHDGRKLEFTQCQKVPLDVNLSDSKVFENSESRTDPKSIIDLSDKLQACTALNVDAKMEGFSTIKIGYSYTSVSGSKVQLSDEATISAFKPLTVIQPKNGETLLSVESSLQVVWTGGPLPWLIEPRNHFHRLEVSDSSVIKAGKRIDIKGSTSIYAFEITCLRLGESELKLFVGNKQSSHLPKPVVVFSKVLVSCGQPAQIELSPEMPQPQGTSQPCPLSARTGRIAAVSYESLPIKVTVLDAKGKRFDNISTLEIDWNLSDELHGSLKTKTGVEYLDSQGAHGVIGFKPIEDAYQTLLTNGKVGNVDVTASLKKNPLYLGFGAIENTLQLNLVNDAIVDTSSISVFNHPNNREYFHVKDGSGFLEVIPGNANVAESKYIASNQTVGIKPLTDGDVTLTLVDLCLKAKKSPVVRVHVTGVHKVEVSMNDKVQKSKLIDAQVRLLDRRGKSLGPSALKYLKIALTSASNILRILANESSNPSDLMFIVHGQQLGDTTITATAKFGTQLTTSLPSPIQVFPPLELEPRNVTLIIGSKFQVRTVGGPQPDSIIEFVLEDSKVADANSAGLIEATKLGSTKLVARAVGVDRISGLKTTYSMDQIDVHVVKFHNIHIHTPLQRIRVGAEMPVLAMGTDNFQNPYSFGSSIPHLHLTWTASHPDSADLVSVYHRNGLDGGKDNNAIMRLIGKKPGRVVIKLHAKITSPISGDQFQFNRDQEFNAKIDVEVFDDLHLTAPKLVNSNALLMTPDSEFQLRTNRESSGEIVYTVLANSGTKKDLISVSKSGVIKSSSGLGSATILVEVSEDFGIVQKMSIVVDVKQINYMMINVEKSFKPAKNSASVQQLPRSWNLPLKMSYHDNTGLKFDVTNINTRYRPSRFDTLLLHEDKNNSINAELVREEFTVLKADAGISGSDLNDFIVINVGKGIRPDIRQDLLIGTVVDFDNLVVSDMDESDVWHWSAEPKEMVDINDKTGVATMLRSGKARVSFHINDKQRTSVDLDIKPASRIVLSKVELLSRKAGDQLIPFLIQSEFGNETSNFIGEANSEYVEHPEPSSLFDCHAKFVSSDTFSQYFDVRAVFDFQTRSYACQLSPKPSLFTSAAASLEEHVELVVLPLHTSRQTLGEAKTTFKFISGFHLPSEKLELTNTKPSGLVAVRGLPAVLKTIKVVPSHTQYMQVGREYMDEEVLMVPVHLRPAYWSDQPQGQQLSVTVTSSLTGESVTLPVKVIFEADSCAHYELGWASLVYFLLAHYQSFIVVIIACIVCVYLTKLIIQSAKSANITTASTAVPSKPPLIGTPLSSSSPLNLTNADNKPYLWTVDNSPIYGSPPVGRRSPRSLTQYSYSDM